MVSRFYTLYDIKTEMFLPPFTAHNDNDAMRQMSMLLKKPTIYQQYPEDYNLYSIGSFDDSKGLVKESPLRIVCGLLKLSTLQQVTNKHIEEFINEEDTANIKDN